MKEYPPRIDTVDVCECGHTTQKHEMRFIDVWNINISGGGKCDICLCPKYKKEKTMTKTEYLAYQDAQRSRT